MSKSKTILLVEDDKGVLGACQIKLEAEGYVVSVAENGQEALETLKKEPAPDLILLDIVMPKMNGFEFLKILKKNKKLKDLDVIVISNLGQDTDVKASMSLGAIDYVIKSDLGIDEVMEKIQAYFSSNGE